MDSSVVEHGDEFTPGTVVSYGAEIINLVVADLRESLSPVVAYSYDPLIMAQRAIRVQQSRVEHALALLLHIKLPITQKDLPDGNA